MQVKKEGDKRITVYLNTETHNRFMRKIFPRKFSKWVREKQLEELGRK